MGGVEVIVLNLLVYILKIIVPTFLLSTGVQFLLRIQISLRH